MPLRLLRPGAVLGAVFAIAACSTAPRNPAPAPVRVSAPAAPARAWLDVIGEYGRDDDVRIVLERNGRLLLHSRAGETDISDAPSSSFARAANGRATEISIGGARFPRRAIGPESGNQLLLPPNRPIADLRREALAASPPNETGDFRPTDLVELTSLDPTIRLEIRYATSNNLFGTPFYSEARAFLQRSAAEALVRASAAVRARGYGLLVHDGYRPWSVTKMFWDAAPADKRNFVANPAQGSRHNRGAAVDLTLYELATGAVVEMPGTYDETTARSAPDYPGGTSRQRWHRDLLRSVMEAQRFTVNEDEWWHFDFADWRSYRIGNLEFANIPR